MIQHQQYADFLAHYGVKGMRWGVRRASKRIDKVKRDYNSRYEDRVLTAKSKKDRKKAKREIGKQFRKEKEEAVRKDLVDRYRNDLDYERSTMGRRAVSGVLFGDSIAGDLANLALTRKERKARKVANQKLVKGKRGVRDSKLKAKSIKISEREGHLGRVRKVEDRLKKEMRSSKLARDSAVAKSSGARKVGTTVRYDLELAKQKYLGNRELARSKRVSNRLRKKNTKQRLRREGLSF